MNTASQRQNDLLTVGGWDHNPSAGFLKSEPTLRFPGGNIADVSDLSFPQAFSVSSISVPQQRGMGTWTRLYIVLVASASFALLLSQIVINGLRRGLWTSTDLSLTALPNVAVHIATTSMLLWVCSGMMVGMTLAILLIRWGVFQKSGHYFFTTLIIQAIPWLYLVVYHQ